MLKGTALLRGSKEGKRKRGLPFKAEDQTSLEKAQLQPTHWMLEHYTEMSSSELDQSQ